MQKAEQTLTILTMKSNKIPKGRNKIDFLREAVDIKCTGAMGISSVHIIPQIQN